MLRFSPLRALTISLSRYSYLWLPRNQRSLDNHSTLKKMVIGNLPAGYNIAKYPNQ